jgi:hypothetical protein
MIEFIKPSVQKQHVSGVVFADYPEKLTYRQNNWLGLDWQKVEHRNPTIWRNVVAWYLRACGVPTGRIAQLLGLSESRALHVGRSARRIATKEPRPLTTINRMLRKQEAQGLRALDPARRAKCVFDKRNADAADAELFLARCIEADLFVVSEALKLGRETLAQAHEQYETLSKKNTPVPEGAGVS